MSLPQVPLQARCLFPLVSSPCSLAVYFPQPSYRSLSPALTIAVHTTLPLFQLCTDVLSSHCPLQKTVHVASHHLGSLKPCKLSLPSFLITFPSRFGEMEAMLSIFSESKTAMGISRKTGTHKICRNTDTHTCISECKLLRE